MRHLLSVSILLYCLIATNEALRILVSFPMISKSHSILGHGVVDSLLEAGHEVVHITSFPKEKPVPNLKEISVKHLGDAILNDDSHSELFKLKNIVGKGNFVGPLMMVFMTYTLHKSFIEEPNVVKLLSDPKEKFDAVVLEWFFSELHAGIAPLLGAPLIWVASTEPHWQALRLIDEIPNPAYSVDLFASRGTPFSFCERVEHLWRIIKTTAILNFIQLPMETWAYNNIYTELAAKRGVTIPSYSEAKYNASLMFMNGHPSIGEALKLPQNAINIAGYHIPSKIKPLPEDLQKVMDGAKNGVIYFSLGSNMKSDGMSEEMKQSLLKMFSKLDQTIIWKFETDMTHTVSNLHLVKWAPQASILAHPNLKLFITHGGKLSTTEAIHYGVPLVGIPIMGDQYINMGSVERKGYGITVPLAEDMADELEAAIRKVLTDERFKTKAKEISKIFHNRPLKPGAALAYWVELVVNTRGAPHLRSPALALPLYQKFYLDLLALILVVVYIVKKLVRYVMKKRCKKSVQKNKKE